MLASYCVQFGNQESSDVRPVILLGASNLTYGFPLIVESLTSSLAAPVALFAAHGHGRSYGIWSRVLGRRLPGIRGCTLWDDLADQPPPSERPLALITDVGNDLLYGADPSTILSWVEECLQRLRALEAHLTITSLPVASVERMSGPRYHATRMLFFPSGGPDWPTMRRMVSELDAGLHDLASQYQGAVITPRQEWYGLDPIHVRRGHRIGAWREILSAWPETPSLSMQQPSVRRAVRLWRLRPAERTVFGRKQATQQPVVDAADRTTIWLY